MDLRDHAARSVARSGSDRDAEHAANRALGQQLVVPGLSLESDDDPFERADEGAGDRARGRPGRHRAGPARGGDEPGAAVHERVDRLLHRASDRVVAAAELRRERDPYARDVAAADDRVPPRERKQRFQRVVLGVGQAADLVGPGLLDPRDDGEREVLLAGEQVI